MKWGLGNKESKRWHANRRQGIPFPIITAGAGGTTLSSFPTLAGLWSSNRL